MKVEPVEYLVTFEDGSKYKLWNADDGMWISLNYDTESIVMDWEIKHKTLEEALETLKKWKEKQDEAI